VALRAPLLLAGLLVAFAVLAADSGEQLRTAALDGDIATVKRLLASGVAADNADRWDMTALGFAAQEGHAAVARLLLEYGANPDQSESFFGSTPLTRALDENHLEIVRLLIAAGAPQRARALDAAIANNDLGLAQAVEASGPIFAWEKALLRERRRTISADLERVLERIRVEADPPPPDYTTAELEAFTGPFEGWDTSDRVVLELRSGRLHLSSEGKEPVALVATDDRAFRALDGDLEATFFGRAGLVEGIRLVGGDSPPITLRRSVAEPVADALDRLEIRSHDELRQPETETVNWPGFRGTNGSGVGDGKDTPSTWNLSDGTGVLWRQELAGLANSSPVVWGDRIVVTTVVADGGSVPLRTGSTGSGEEVEEARQHRWLVLAFDKRTGEKLWETEVGRAIPTTRRHFKATQANSSPATDGRHLVVIFPTAGLACLDLDGKIRWKHDLGGLNAGGFNDPSLQWGYASSPLIYRDRVILQVDIHDGPYIAAWDLESGRPLWRTERPDVAPSWSTPALWQTPSGDEIVVNASVIHGYDPENGNDLWSLGPSSVQVVAMPVVGDDAVFVGAGYPPVKPIFAIRPGLRGEHWLEPGGADAALLWSHNRGGAYLPTPLLYRGLLYVVHHNGRIVAYNASNGEALYKARFSSIGTFSSSPIAVNGKIYTGTEEGLMYVLAAGPEFEELAVHDFEEPLMATPAVSEGVLFVRTPSKIWALARPESSPEPASR
jgi:outer membrane protein assembly factor BamB